MKEILKLYVFALFFSFFFCVCVCTMLIYSSSIFIIKKFNLNFLITPLKKIPTAATI